MRRINRVLYSVSVRRIGGSIGILLGFSIYGTVTSLFAKKPADEKKQPADDEIRLAVEAVEKKLSHNSLHMDAMAKAIATLHYEMSRIMQKPQQHWLRLQAGVDLISLNKDSIIQGVPDRYVPPL